MEVVPESMFGLNGCQFVCRDNTNDRDVVRSIFEGEYDLPDVSQYEHGSASLDIGAHIGAYAVWACDTYPLLKVLAVEPVPENMRLLDQNRKLNVLEPRIRGLQRAVGSRDDGMAHLNYDANAIERFVAKPVSGEGPHTLDVRTVCFGSLLSVTARLFGARKIWSLKLDCEGGESGLLEGASEQELRRVKWVVGEHHDTAELIEKTFKGCGFQARQMKPNLNKHLFCYENPINFKDL